MGKLINNLVERYKKNKKLGKDTRELLDYLPLNMYSDTNARIASGAIRNSLKRGDRGAAKLFVDSQLEKYGEQTKGTPSAGFAADRRKKLNYKPERYTPVK